MNDAPVCVFGEVLFDCFPDGKSVLGGAPFNVAWHLQAFGAAPVFHSRIGDDPAGGNVCRAMRDWQMDSRALQTDTERPTGRVSITLVDGEPEYDIVAPAAYDAIDPPVAGCDCRLLYHGSLALRNAGSREALEQLRSTNPDIVFMDVNLRSPWWQRDRVLEMVHRADWVKLNGDELALLQPALAGDSLHDSEFLAAHGLKGLILTHGARGAELLTDSGERFKVRPRQDIRVVDTVGAGDAFAAVIILGLINSWSLGLTLERAQAFAAKMVGNRGATVSDRGFYQSFIDAWKLESCS